LPYDPEQHNRRSIRLAGFDYTTPGAYFLTICTYQRQPILDGAENRAIVAYAWRDLSNKFRHLDLDAFTIMPDHIHAIVILGERPSFVGAGVRPNQCPSSRSFATPAQAGLAANRWGLPAVVRQFKNRSARRINSRRGLSGVPVWQRNYWEHIVRCDRSFGRIREYILSNPVCNGLDAALEAAAAQGEEAMWNWLEDNRRVVLPPR
jgi:putative transposase